jgi:hypothetical protein
MFENQRDFLVESGNFLAVSREKNNWDAAREVILWLS